MARRRTGWLTAGACAHLFMLLLLYVYWFAEDEGVRLTSFARYGTAPSSRLRRTAPNGALQRQARQIVPLPVVRLIS